MKIIIFSFVAFLLLNSCKEDSKDHYFDKICKDDFGFKVDSSKQSLTYAAKSNSKYLSLRDVSYPSDTFYLRIEYSNDTAVKIFEYSFYKRKTSFKVYRFPLEYPINGKMLFDNNKDRLENFTQTFRSENKDAEFIEELEKSNLLNFSSNFVVENYPAAPYEDYYYIEFSNKCRYDIFSFGDPFKNSSRFIEAKKIATFLIYLKKEFSF